MRLFPLALLLAVPLHAIEFGEEGFGYPDNSAIAGQTGGTGFNYDNFDHAVTTTTSDWDNVFGAPTVVSGKLLTANSGAKREYNGNIEGAGNGSNDGQDNHERSGAVRGQDRVFYRFDMTRVSGGSWSGASSYDFTTERVFFGVPSVANPASGNQEYGCEITATGTRYFSGIPASGTTRTIVTVLDFDRDFIGLWVDPDAEDFYQDSTGANSCDAGGPYTATTWSSAVRLASGGNCEWDHLVVATSWDDFEFIDPDTDDDGMPDDWETDNDLVVGIDDSLLDADTDDLSNLDEYLRKTDPQVPDSDNDDFTDGEEVTAGTNPLSPSSYPGAVHPPGLVGGERFDYADGPVTGMAGGLYWDADNSTENNAFLGHTGTPSDWDATFGSPQVISGVLVTQEGGAKREYNGPIEGAQAASDERAGSVSGEANFSSHVVYYKFEMTRAANATWSGASSYDFESERYLFGVPGAANPASGVREFAIHDLNTNQWAYSGIAPVAGVKYTIVAKLDFDADVAALYLNPDLDQGEGSNTPVASYAHTSANWSSSVRFASGGGGAVEWDNVRVAYTWDDLNDGPPVANDDSATMHHLGKARFKVLANDSGLLATSSLAIETPPAHGTATANADGTILYQHLSGTPASDSFTYRIQGAGSTLADTATVTVHFAESARFDSAFVSMPTTPPVGELQLEDAFPGITFESPHSFSTVAGDNRKLFVAEGDGRVFLIPDMAAPTKVQVLDLTGSVQHDNNEQAFKGIAAHPDWANNGQIYVTYNSNAGTVRLSRFTCQTSAPFTAGTEEIVIEQDCDDSIHNIGTCEFGPDGYLYVGFGDEGTQADGHNNSQHVDRNLWSCIIRIDVDLRPGSLPPNPDPGPDTDPEGNDADLVIPRPGGIARYAVPPNNPLVGATTFNGVALDPGQLRTEIFVMGLRNPWQFSAEDNDGNGTVDELWVGDVGRSNREEVNVFLAGGNGGWGWREGSQAGQRAGDLLNGAAESAATLTEPLWDYAQGGSAYQGRSITGGFVHRGSAIAGLTGKYICADYVSGNIWSVERTLGAPVIERLAGEVAIVGLLPDPATGGILLLDRGNNGTNQGTGGIKRLTLGTDDSAFPPTLAATNFFADLADLSPNPGGHFYEPNLRFWSDLAEKKRWFLVNDATDTVGYSQNAPWSFPAGMIWVKHFDYPVAWETFTRTIDGQSYTDRRPAVGSPRRRLETRFLVKNETGSYGISYRWNSVNGGTQTDAVLAGDHGESMAVNITLDGAPANFTWEIPSRAACMTCHTPEAGHALSFNARQLNAPGSIAGVSGNLLGSLATTGYLNGFSGDPSGLPRHYRPDESGQSLEARVRSYLDVNCAYCHQSGGTGGGNWDGRAHLSLLETGLLNGTTVDAPLHPDDRLVVAGNVPHSILFNRIAGANGYSRMPPLASIQPDLEAAELVAAWITQEVHPYATYEEWRSVEFGNDSSPEGELAANPDEDGLDNFGEWAFGTNPALTDDFRATPSLLLVQPAAGEFRFNHRRLRMHATAGLHYEYRSSENLIDWSPISVTEESTSVSEDDPAYETVTLSIVPGAVTGSSKLFLQVRIQP
ncbi:PQQ-dependent sugar dehydrogenase [Luteolibacter arcticus]|uniref:PQQ-dependent sugar dehydrogenase n=1 Tax=Luteolibacter arcticus TaxID=1581411 RepID=A0ABT3GLK4_9BACT|nr:PQQ-dependent sugar dehydrogenase [Luteolibacter arcticus]MCW1924394.1 PQQ-dependent sugar dehydrogenase [Luteolibacter arcticus]